MYRAYILDDELKAIETMVFLLGHALPEISDIRTQTDPLIAIQEINQDPPDILFLDIQMPIRTGFDVIREINNPDFEIIFTTAHDQFAIDAIKVSALDYLLKPVELELLQKSFKRFKQRSQMFNYKKELGLLKQQIQNNRKRRLTLHDLNGIKVVTLDNVIRLQADGNYTKIYMNDGQVFMNTKTLKEFDDILSGSDFLRVHKSHLINVDKITAFLKNEYLVLTDKSEIPVARRKRKELREMLT